MTDKMREEFEAAFVRRQVDSQGEGFRSSAIYMLKRDGDFEKPPSHYELQRRELGLYDAHWVEMAWWAWQASREALVVEWPDHYDYTNSDIAGAASLDCRTAFGKAVKVKP